MMKNVQVLFSDGCPHAPATIELIKNVSAKMELDIHLEAVQVNNEKHAREVNFLGSPTIRINGIDIDPSARNALFSGFT
jgi:glutaredoxin